MLRYAFVNDVRTLPTPGARATCPDCEDTLIAVCGEVVTHHWRHLTGSDCDSWSENVGPWHVSWQSLVDPRYVEVSLGEHRADIRTANDVVIELQHSPIKPDDIRARESFYGNMIWVFDATHRFADAHLGEISVFSLGRTKHLDVCAKPIFLDFGDYLVEVIAFTDLLSRRCHGFGRIRSHEWFSTQFFASIRLNADPIKIAKSKPAQADPWERKKPYRFTEFPTVWKTSDGDERTIPKWTKYLPMNLVWRDSNEPLTTDIINQFRELGNGWIPDALRRMKAFLNGSALLLDGCIRIMPPKREFMRNEKTITETQVNIRDMSTHIDAGRIPILKESTIEHLVELAKSYEIRTYGRLLNSPEQRDPQQSLFGEEDA